jgi:hypothetical protein
MKLVVVISLLIPLVTHFDEHPIKTTLIPNSSEILSDYEGAHHTYHKPSQSKGKDRR